MRLRFFFFFLAAGLGAAQAEVISIFSGDDLTGSSEWNNMTGANVLVNPYAAPIWASSTLGGRWISYGLTGAGQTSPSNVSMNAGNIEGNPTAIFFERFYLPGYAMSGGLWVWADDTAMVLIDGVPAFNSSSGVNHDAHCRNGVIGCQPGEGAYISLAGLDEGDHSLEFRVYQLWGDSFGLLYEGGVTAAPEPSSLLLVGSGAVAAWRWVRRRRQ